MSLAFTSTGGYFVPKLIALSQTLVLYLHKQVPKVQKLNKNSVVIESPVPNYTFRRLNSPTHVPMHCS